MSARSVPFGITRRTRPLVFSLRPRCQEAGSSQSQMSIFRRRACSGWQAISEPRSQVIERRIWRGRCFIWRLKASSAAVALRLAQNHKACFAFNPRARPDERLKAPLIRSPSCQPTGDCGAIAERPVAWYQSRLDVLGTVDNTQCFQDHGTACQRRAYSGTSGHRFRSHPATCSDTFGHL
jgi:hypothetical protein